MGYTMQNGRYADTEEVSLGAIVQQSTTFTTDPVELGDRSTLRLDLVVTEVSGTDPTLDASIETSKDTLSWRPIGSFAQATGPTSERKSFPGCDRFARAVFTIGGTSPSFTAAVTGEAV